MAPRRKPSSLYSIALRNMGSILEATTHKIQELYGSYDLKETRAKCNEIRMKLGNTLAPEVLDELCAARRVHSSSWVIRDGRITLDIFIHPELKSFEHSWEDFNELYIPPYDSFWLNRIKILTQLQSISLLFLCVTDALLSQLAQCCPAIEEVICRAIDVEINLVERGHCSVMITPDGLLQLSKCQHLRHLELPYNVCKRNPCPCFLGQAKETEQVMLTLLTSTPMQKVIKYDLTSLIAANVESMPILSLSELKIKNAFTEHISAINRVCPILKSLTLEVVWNPQFGLELPDQEENQRVIRPTVFSELASSCLRLTELRVNSAFQCDANFIKFITAKGEHLTHLILSSFYQSEQLFLQMCPDSSDIHTIASTCPVLEVFKVRELRSDRIASPEYLEYPTTQPFFSRLHTLSIYGKGWASWRILPLCLNHALLIENLTIENQRYYYQHLLEANDNTNYEIGELLSSIFTRNPMSELRSIRVSVNLHISSRNLDYMMEECPNLKNIVISHVPDVPTFHLMQRYITERNFDLILSNG